MNEVGKRTREEETNEKVTSGKKKSKGIRNRVSDCEFTGQFNGKFIQEDVKEQIRDAWLNNEKLHLDSGASVLKDPFACCTLENFVQDDQFLNSLVDELLELEFFEKDNDLYKFYQTTDLKSVNLPYVNSLKQFLYKNFLGWLKDVTQIELEDQVDMNCARYDFTDVLLCHDDELEGRRVAFILYLVPPWKATDGGCLDLFNLDANGQPNEAVVSIVPAWNKFVFFEVTPVSFHQVSEVLTRDKHRLSISGWFHGASVPRPSPWLESPRILRPFEIIDESTLLTWINPMYLDPSVQASIRHKFETDSEIELQDFLKADKYEQMCIELSNNELAWNFRGPANRRHYEVLKDDSIPPSSNECLALLRSEIMAIILSNMTGLRLHELVPESDSDSEDKEKDDEEDESAVRSAECDAQCSVEVQRWRHGSYTLMHDHEQENMTKPVLDCTLSFNCEFWQSNKNGGYVSYIAKGEDEELLTVIPSKNALAIVYRDLETLRFVKYVNSNASDVEQYSEYHNIYALYSP